jgi:hypothetical protein
MVVKRGTHHAASVAAIALTFLAACRAVTPRDSTSGASAQMISHEHQTNVLSAFFSVVGTDLGGWRVRGATPTQTGAVLWISPAEGTSARLDARRISEATVVCSLLGTEAWDAVGPGGTIGLVVYPPSLASPKGSIQCRRRVGGASPNPSNLDPPVK